MKYRSKHDNIADIAIDRVEDQTRVDEAKFSQMRDGLVVPTGSHRKQLAEQGQFRAPHSTRHRPVRSIEQPIYDVAFVHAQDVHDPAVETNVTHIADMVADEVVQPDVGVANEMVKPDVVVVDLIPYATTDTKVTTPLTESPVHIDGGFPGESIDRSMLIEYADHVEELTCQTPVISGTP